MQEDARRRLRQAEVAIRRADRGAIVTATTTTTTAAVGVVDDVNAIGWTSRERIQDLQMSRVRPKSVLFSRRKRRAAFGGIFLVMWE